MSQCPEWGGAIFCLSCWFSHARLAKQVTSLQSITVATSASQRKPTNTSLFVSPHVICSGTSPNPCVASSATSSRLCQQLNFQHMVGDITFFVFVLNIGTGSWGFENSTLRRPTCFSQSSIWSSPTRNCGRYLIELFCPVWDCPLFLSWPTTFWLKEVGETVSGSGDETWSPWDCREGAFLWERSHMTTWCQTHTRTHTDK